MNQRSQQVSLEDEVCVICKERLTDSVKLNFWPYDMTCAVCIDEQAKYEKREVPRIIGSPLGMLEYEMLALGAIARKLNSEGTKRKGRQFDPVRSI